MIYVIIYLVIGILFLIKIRNKEDFFANRPTGFWGYLAAEIVSLYIVLFWALILLGITFTVKGEG